MPTDPFRAYWNNVELEREKAFWIEDASDRKLLDYLQRETNLQRGMQDGLAFAQGFGGVRGQVLEIGAGAGWATALTSRLPAVEGIVAVDYSRHRLRSLSPLVFQQLSGELAKVRFVEADVFGLDLAPGTFDAVLFCQSFYMFHPLTPLAQLAFRALRSGGMALVCCEDFMGDDAEPPQHDISGRYYYHCDDAYRRAFEEAGFLFHRQPLEYQFYPANTWARPTANYLMLKE